MAVEVHDASRTYGYADVFHLQLRVEVRVPGHPEAHHRLIERTGVRAQDLERCRQELLDSFRRTLPYLFREDFPRRYIRTRRRRTTASTAVGFGGSP